MVVMAVIVIMVVMMFHERQLHGTGEGRQNNIFCVVVCPLSEGHKGAVR